MRLKVRLFTQFPLSLNFGGLELQALKYKEMIQSFDYDVDFLSLGDMNDTFDILHIFGASIEVARASLLAKQKGIKVIVSPVFYKNISPFSMKCAKLFFQYFPYIPKSLSNIHALLHKADLLLPNSNSEAKMIDAIFGIPQKNQKVIRNGVEKNRFDNCNASMFRNKYNIKTNYILNVAMIDKRKNTLNLIKAFLPLNTDYKLVIVGDFRLFNHKKYNQEIQYYFNTNKDRIIHIGKLTHSSELLNSAYLGASIHALPSDFETPGLSSLEAGLAGCKLLIGTCDPTEEYFKNYVEYVNPQSIDDIRRGLQTLIKDEQITNLELKNFILQNYTWEKISSDLHNVYKSVASNGK